MQGPKWYNYLNNKRRTSLLQREKQDGLIICWERANRQYARFDGVNEFANLMIRKTSSDRTFHEVIIGNQKPHFDIDGAENMEQFSRAVDEIITAILDLLKIPLGRILLLTSHGPDKISGHLVVDRFCHSDHQQAKAFFNLVKNQVSEETVKILDVGVYSSVQNFRIAGCQKPYTQRIKRLEEYTYRGQKVNYLFFEDYGNDLVGLLHASLLGQTQGCKMLEDVTISKKFSDQTYTSDEIDEILELCREHFNNDFPFHFLGIKGSFITLRRLVASFCERCQRIHEHDNPYIIRDGRYIYFHCRRGQNRTLVGEIEMNIELPFEPTEDEIRKFEIEMELVPEPEEEEICGISIDKLQEMLPFIFSMGKPIPEKPSVKVIREIPKITPAAPVIQKFVPNVPIEEKSQPKKSIKFNPKVNIETKFTMVDKPATFIIEDLNKTLRPVCKRKEADNNASNKNNDYGFPDSLY